MSASAGVSPGGALRDFLVMARFPFHIVGVLPFLFGALLALKAGSFDPLVFFLSLACVMLVICATHFNGECYDVEEDSRCGRRSVFSSGTGVALTGRLPRPAIALAATLAGASALAIGCLLQFGLGTGPLTLALGLAGLLPAYFYSKPPLRLVSRGVGEFLIAFCYGWLAPACGFYPQAGYFHPFINWAAPAIALATVNVIWVNEILDLPQDTAAGKKNLVVRLGLRRAVSGYCFIAFCASVWSFASLSRIGAVRFSALFVPALALSFAACVLLNHCPERVPLLSACGATILADIALNAAYLGVAILL